MVGETSPQHETPPFAVSAQAETVPTDTAVTPLVRPPTGAGTELPLTNGLWAIVPQHFSSPLAVSAQAENPIDTATDTAVTPDARPVIRTGIALAPESLPKWRPQHCTLPLAVTAHAGG